MEQQQQLKTSLYKLLSSCLIRLIKHDKNYTTFDIKQHPRTNAQFKQKQVQKPRRIFDF